MRDRLAPVLAVVTAMLLTASVASAAFVDHDNASATLSTNTLQPPTNPTTAAGPCTLGVAASVTVGWSPTPSTWADGYQVKASLVSGGPYTTVGTVGPTTTTYTVSGLSFATTYYYVVVATKGQWRSAPTAQVSRTTLSPLCN